MDNASNTARTTDNGIRYHVANGKLVAGAPATSPADAHTSANGIRYQVVNGKLVAAK